MHALYVHGMGRTPLSGWPLVRALGRAGMRTSTFAYSATLQDFRSIEGRLRRRLERIARDGPYIVIGHSLGGLLLRAAIASLEASVPRPLHLFLLGSPIEPSSIAAGLRRNPAYRFFTGDCGQMFASGERMASVGASTVPTTAIVGTRSPLLAQGFGHEPNDGLVSVGEASAAWLTDQVKVPVIHTLLPASRVVSSIILERTAARGTRFSGAR
jgi:hypothetical protein